MFKKLNENKLFEELYIVCVFLIALIGWFFKSQYGYTAIAIVSFVTVMLFNDVKYLVPCGLGMVFSIGSGFETNSSYGPLIGSVLIYASSFIVFVIRNGLNFKNFKSFKGLLILAILSFIPLIYRNTIKDGISSGVLDNSAVSLYVLYFGYFAYVLLYFLFAMTLKKDSLRIIFKTIGYMTIILSLECFIHVVIDGFNKGYRLGWGHCNEAGILMLFGLPFIMVGLVKADKISEMIVAIIKFLIAIVGIICSTSRGTYLFGFIEVVVLLIYTLIKSKHWKSILIILISCLIVGIIGIQIKIGIVKLVRDIIDLLLYRGFEFGDRTRLFKQSIVIWNENWLTRLFGAGIVAELAINRVGFEDMNTFVVYHSTFFSCLATLGICGVLALIYHFYERYSQMKYFEKDVMVILLIGFIMLDIYGMMDNTYGMYYFMIPLVIFMAAVDCCTSDESVKKIELDLR